MVRFDDIIVTLLPRVITCFDWLCFTLDIEDTMIGFAMKHDYMCDQGFVL